MSKRKNAKSSKLELKSDKPRLPFWGQAAAIVVATALVYIPALELGWIWDDDQYVYNNPLLRDFSGLWSIWFEPDKSPQYYPIVFTTLWIQFQLFGESASGYHTVNVALHALNGVLLLAILRRIPVKFAFPIALAWSLHPIQVESVAWCTELKNVLSAAFYGAAWLALWPLFCSQQSGEHSPEPGNSKLQTMSFWKRYAIGAFFVLMALLSKSVTASMPAALCLVLWFKQGKIPWQAIKILTPLLIVGGLLGWNTARLERIHVGAFGAEWDHGLLDRIGIAARSLVHYALNSLVPIEQVFFYPRFEVGWRSVGNLFAILFVACVAGASIWLALRGRRGVFTCLGMFAGSAFPALGFLNVYPHRFSFVADHFVYIASVGLICLWWAALMTLLDWGSKRFQAERFLWVPVAFVLGLYGLAVNRHLPVFSSQVTLWEDTLAKNPECPAAMQNLGLQYVLSDRLLEAESVLDQAMEFDFDRFQTLNSLGLLYEKQGRNSEALDAFVDAAKLNPLPVRPYVNAANILRREQAFENLPNRNDLVVNYYTKAWEAQENYVSAFGLGTTFYENEDFLTASDWFGKAAKLVPTDLDARYNEVQALFDAKLVSESRDAAQRLVAEFPDDKACRDLAALVAQKVGEAEEN